MSKSNPDPKTRILLTDSPLVARDKLRTAVTDSIPDISYDPNLRPGVSNLFDILSGLTGTSPEDLALQFEGKSMKDLKTTVSDALAPVLVEFQNRFDELRKDPGYLESIEAQGRKKAESRAEETMAKVRRVVGLC